MPKEGPETEDMPRVRLIEPLTRNTSACVWWDFQPYKSDACLASYCQTSAELKRLHDHQNDDADHENSRYFIDYSIEFLTF